MNNPLPVPVGFVRSSPLYTLDQGPARPAHAYIHMRYPMRLEAMALDTSKIGLQDDGNYSAGQINFKIKLFRDVHIRVGSGNGDIHIDPNAQRPALVRHSAELMRTLLGFTDELEISTSAELELRHCGFGSSSNVIAAVGHAINELYGSPLDPHQLAAYLAKNHGEEIDSSPDMVSPVQCIGGSALAGLANGSIFVVAGAHKIIAEADIPEGYYIVAGVPADYTFPDAHTLLKKEAKQMSKFIRTGKKYGAVIAYRLVHEALPALKDGNIGPIGNLIFDYRFRMGSIRNCSFVYPRMMVLARKLEALKHDGRAEILSLSSVGPGFFVVTRDPKYCTEAFEALNLTTYTLEPYNGGYQITYE